MTIGSQQVAILVGCSQPRPQDTTVANPAGVLKFEHHFQVLDLVEGGVPPTETGHKNMGWGLRRIHSKMGSGFSKV